MEKLRETLRVRKERAILVAAVLGSDRDDLVELTALAESAGAVVVDRFQQKIRTIHPSTYIGKGKAHQLAERVKRFKADVVIFDNDLSPAQIRELEEIIRIKVLDRSELILDIFATRAKTKQAKLQVELAQLEYTYPRLTQMWSHLGYGDRSGGATGGGRRRRHRHQRPRRTAAGNRPPAGQQTDQRAYDANWRTSTDASSARSQGRKDFFKICIVGYTNAGKSTLLNALTDAGVLVEDQALRHARHANEKMDAGPRVQKSSSATRSDSCGTCRTNLWPRSRRRWKRRSMPICCCT